MVSKTFCTGSMQVLNRVVQDFHIQLTEKPWIFTFMYNHDQLNTTFGLLNMAHQVEAIANSLEGNYKLFAKGRPLE